jgi:formiminotetrahydrofolate cyclodeaminase
VTARSAPLDLRVREFLDELAAGGSPLPGGGAAAALATGMAAGLLAMVARRSPEWPEGRGAAAQAEALRLRAVRLAPSVERAYQRALDLLDASSDDVELGEALHRAAEAPLRLTELAADAAVLAGEVAEHGEPALRPDTAVAAALAQAGALAGAHLVRSNLATQPGDAWAARAAELADTASRAARRTLES